MLSILLLISKISATTPLRKKKPAYNSLEEVDPEILKTFERLGFPLDEQKRLTNVAVDLVFDSVRLERPSKRS